MYDLLEYSDNYEDTTGSLFQFKRDEPPDGNGNVDNNTTSLKYKSITGIIGIKLVVSLKYVSNFFRSLEMPLVNCKVDLELTWNRNCVVCSADGVGGNQVTFKVTDTKLYVPIVSLSTKDNTNLTKQLNEGFKRTIYWNRYKSIAIAVTAKVVDGNKVSTQFRKLLDASYEGVNRLFLLGYSTTGDIDHNIYRKYLLPTIDITDYNVIIDGRNFYDQPINSSIRKYDEIRKIATGKGNNYATGCLLDYKYFKDFYQLLAIDLSKQKELDADPRVFQQIEFIGSVNDDVVILAVLEQSKETVLEFYKGTAKVM